MPPTEKLFGVKCDIKSRLWTQRTVWKDKKESNSKVIVVIRANKDIFWKIK